MMRPMPSREDKPGTELTLNQTKRLLDDFTSLENAALERESTALTALLDDFTRILYASVKNDCEAFTSLLDDFDRARRERLQSQKATAEDIDILSITGFYRDENTHSDFLRFFLDPEESHAQRSAFFRLLLKELELPAEYADADYYVRRETHTYVEGVGSRIDIEIFCPGSSGFVIHIENKVRDLPKEWQLTREQKALELCRERYGVPPERAHGVLLSPRDSDRSVLPAGFKFLHWSRMAALFDAYAADPEVAPRARFAAEQYRKCIRHWVMTEEQQETEATGGQVEI